MHLTAPNPLPERADDAPKGARRRLALIVDDSRLQRRILCKSVRAWGFDVIEAASGDAALEL